MRVCAAFDRSGQDERQIGALGSRAIALGDLLITELRPELGPDSGAVAGPEVEGGTA